jgi:hypothetical protein
LKTLRLLLWLRWRLAMNTTTRRGRWAMAGITALLALVFAPIYLGAAAAAGIYASQRGADALLLVFGLCQFNIVWVSLLAGALGRMFELDKLKRYPFRPVAVFSVNALASLTEPIVLMAVPALAGAAIGVARHDGALAGVQTGVGGLLLLALTACWLQLLLALLDDMLRREWMRYVAAFLFTLTILALQLGVGSTSRRLAEQAKRAGVTPESLIAQAEQVFQALPTTAAPAALAGAHPGGAFGSPAVAILLCLVGLALPLAWGSRVMARASIREPLAGRVRRARSAAGAFGWRWPGLSAVQAVLVRREWLYVIRTPAILYQMVVVPLTVVVIAVLGRSRERGFDVLLPAFVMTSTLSARNLMLWGFDGAGIRSLFLLPFTARDLVLTKNLVWLGTAFLEAGVTLTALTIARPARFLPELPLLGLGYAAVAFAAGAVGTWVSITHPTKPRERGMSRRSPGGVMGLLAYLAVLVLGAAIVLAILAVRSLTPDPYDELGSHAVVVVALVACAGLWWLAMDRHADALERSREKLVDVIGKSADA